MSKTYIFGMILVYVCVFGLALPGFSVPGSSMYAGNGSHRCFTYPSGNQTKSDSSEHIKDLIINASTSFSEGKANIDMLVSKLGTTQQPGISYDELNTIVSDALTNMKAARNYYQTLNGMVATLPYNPEVIDQLKVFDYYSLTSEYGMNKDIFNKVKNFLQLGNVRGTYARLFAYTDTIVEILETVQKEISSGVIPETESIARLNQECLYSIMFDHYITQIFKHIRV